MSIREVEVDHVSTSPFMVIATSTAHRRLAISRPCTCYFCSASCCFVCSPSAILASSGSFLLPPDYAHFCRDYSWLASMTESFLCPLPQVVVVVVMAPLHGCGGALGFCSSSPSSTKSRYKPLRVSRSCWTGSQRVNQLWNMDVDCAHH